MTHAVHHIFVVIIVFSWTLIFVKVYNIDMQLCFYSTTYLNLTINAMHILSVTHFWTILYANTAQTQSFGCILN